MPHASAKVNIFLKITGTRGDYHEILSRFMRIDALYDTLEFVPKTEPEFEIIGDFTCKIEANTIYKAYRHLLEATHSKTLQSLLQSYAIKVEKRIPAFAGLGGGSSDAATFLKMCNKEAKLGLHIKELAAIGAKVGADVPFFIYDYPSANVSGIGEIVSAFDEAPLKLEVVTPPDIAISTPDVYKTYRQHFFAPIDALTCNAYAHMTSREALQTLTCNEANDLFAPALKLHPELTSYTKTDWFFSGSGSSFFRLKEEQ